MALPEQAVFDFLDLRPADLLPEIETPPRGTFSDDQLRSYVTLVDDPSRRAWLDRQITSVMDRLDRA